MINEEKGKRIKEIRKSKKMTIKKLGQLVNLHESTVSRYEKGEIQSLDVEKLKEFAKALDVSPTYLMGWNDQKKSPTNLGELLKEHKKTVIEVSRDLDIDVQSLDDLEKGATVPISLIKKVAGYFNVSLDDLLNPTFYKNPNESDVSAAVRVTNRRGKWFKELEGVVFTDDEMDELINFAKYLLSKRKKD